MKKFIKNAFAMVLIGLCSLPAMAQLNGTGFYRFRNADRTNDYISLTNDKFNFSTAIGTACGGLSKAYTTEGQQRAMECVARYLQTDIHMVDDSDWIIPASVIYAQKRTTNPTDYEYNLIGQGTSLLTLTSGYYPGSVISLTFDERYITIAPMSGQDTYTATIELKASNYSIANLGKRYFVDIDGQFSVASNANLEGQWYIEPVDHFNVVPEVEFNGKYYTTLHVPYAFVLSGQVLNAYAITSVNADGTLNYNVIATAGGTVPAGTPVVLECGSANPAECQLIPSGSPIFTAPDNTITTGAPAANETSNYTGTNILKGTYFCNTDGSLTFPTPSGTSSFNANHFTAPTSPQKYVIGITESGKLGFVTATGSTMPANKAWLDSAAEFPWELPVTILLGDVNDDGEVNIKDVTDLIDYLLGGNIENFNEANADLDASSNIAINDVTLLIDLLLTGSAE